MAASSIARKHMPKMARESVLSPGATGKTDEPQPRLRPPAPAVREANLPEGARKRGPPQALELRTLGLSPLPQLLPQMGLGHGHPAKVLGNPDAPYLVDPKIGRSRGLEPSFDQGLVQHVGQETGLAPQGHGLPPRLAH